MPINPTPETVEFHYLKDDRYTEMPCTGAIGGLTPDGAVWIGLYSERFSVPKKVRYQPVPTGKRGEVAMEEVSREGIEGIVRLLHAGVRMSPNTARSLAKMLHEIAEKSGEE